MQNTPNGRSKNKKCFKRSVVFLVQRLGKEILKSRITFKLRKSAKHPPPPFVVALWMEPVNGQTPVAELLPAGPLGHLPQC